ncbi:MAG: redox-regulated ATPase YchF [Promethearchaeati archaeon SRVP18_Atabeyarchaeia-1]
MAGIGIVGKPASGKTTLTNAACMTSYKVTGVPFTTIDAQFGVTYVRVKCCCKELGVKDNPRNSKCIDGVRYVPVKLVDVAGLIPGSHTGKGLGNQFLTDMAEQSSALIQVVDASGSSDFEGKMVGPGTHDPVEDVKFLEQEIDLWLLDIIKRDWAKIAARAEGERKPLAPLLLEKLSGLGITMSQVAEAMAKTGLKTERPKSIGERELQNLASSLRRIAKPMLIAANKIDIKSADSNLVRMRELLKDYFVIPTCGLGEYALRKLSDNGIIAYNPGDIDFRILEPEKISEKEKESLTRLKKEVLQKYGSTGVQDAIDKAVFGLLKMIYVFPVEDQNSFTDHEGRVLPDVFLAPLGTTPKELAYMIHTDLGETYAGAIDAKRKTRVREDYQLKNGDVIKIIAAGAK